MTLTPRTGTGSEVNLLPLAEDILLISVTEFLPKLKLKAISLALVSQSSLPFGSLLVSSAALIKNWGENVPVMIVTPKLFLLQQHHLLEN